MPPQRKGNVSGGRNEVVLQNGRTVTRTRGNERSRTPTHRAETNEMGTAPQAHSTPANANIDQPMTSSKEQRQADSPDHDKPPLTSTRTRTMRTHEKETQDINMADPHTIGGGGGKERGKTGTNPAWNSKSGIPCDIPTPPEAPRMVAHRSEIAGATNPQAVLDKLLSMQISVTAREMIAASPSISKALAEMIRVRNVPSANVISQSHHTSGC